MGVFMGVFMNKAIKMDIVSRVYENTDLEKDDAKKYTDFVLDAIKNILLEGNSLEIRGFGTFEIKQWDNRIMKNPKNGQPVDIPAHKSVVFHPGKDLKYF